MCDVLDRAEIRGEIKGAIKVYREEMNLSYEEIMDRIMVRFKLKKETAEKYVEETLGVQMA